MKICKSILGIMLLGIVSVFSGCSDAEEVHYYSYRNIEYSIGSGDGMTEYETPWEECYILVNQSEVSEVKAGPSDIYIGYRERYCFQSDDPLFNPTPGHVHVPLPESLTSGNQVAYDEREGEYSQEEVEVNQSKDPQIYTIPPKTKLTLECKVKMKKLVLSYKASFQRHPGGADHVVTGKFIRHIPVGISLVEKYEPIDK